MFDVIFQALFTYRPVVFQQGQVRLDPSSGSYLAVALAVAVLAAAVVTLRGTGGRGRPRDRAVLLTLRLLALAVVAVCLFRPILVVKAAVPQQNVLAVLLDDSRSMQVPDYGGKPRGTYLQEQFGPQGSALQKSLTDKFLVKTFHFSSGLTRGEGEGFTFSGSQTRLGEALDAARHELAGLPLAGLVVVSDGADTSEAALSNALLGLKAEKVPVFTVGVGRETLEKDVQVDRVEVPSSVLLGSSLLVDVTIRHTGYAGQDVTVDVEDDGRIVGSTKTKLSADGAPTTVRVRAIASEAGPRVFRFKVAPLPGETLPQNNVREATIDVRDVKEKVLYFEGEPRFEMKFMRRAVADDKNLQVVALQRTADNKYLRLDVDSAEELVAGFPKTREELFAYRALILGSVEAGAFSGDQLRMIAEFVDVRGGGLLMMGGARAFSEGGYVGTPVADALPVVLERAAGKSIMDDATAGPPMARLKVVPTRAGLEHAATQIAGTPEASAKRWKELPPITTVNHILSVKPGATALLEGTDEKGRTEVVLAAQRFGRGKVLAFTPQDSWVWQMHASIPLEDQTHENLWRQIVRWLVDGVPGRVEVRTSTERVEPGEPVTVEATVDDAAFAGLNDATVSATVTRPDGETEQVPLSWTGDRPGQYRGSFVSKAHGRYQVKVTAQRAGAEIGVGDAWVRAETSDAEFFDATMHAETLRRISSDTGGRYYTPETASGLAEDVRYGGRGVTTIEEYELWQMPVVLVLLLGLICTEWGYRRAVGLS